MILLEKVISRHIDFAKQLIPRNKQNVVFEDIRNITDDLKETLNGIYLLRELSKHSLDQALGTGEILSSLIISNLIADSRLIDTRNFIKTDSNFGYATVDLKRPTA